jgi:uncharacterized protein (TIGR02611 family)
VTQWERFKAVLKFIGRSSKRIAVTIAGLTVLAAGIAMLALPGPGLLVVVLGLAILASEYVWARRALDMAKRKAKQARAKAGGLFRRRNNKKTSP